MECGNFPQSANHCCTTRYFTADEVKGGGLEGEGEHRVGKTFVFPLKTLHIKSKRCYCEILWWCPFIIWRNGERHIEEKPLTETQILPKFQVSYF